MESLALMTEASPTFVENASVEVSNMSCHKILNPASRYSIATILLIEAFLSFVGNGLICLVILTDSTLRSQPQVILLLNLAIVDFLNFLPLTQSSINMMLACVIIPMQKISIRMMISIWRCESIIMVTFISVCRYVIVCKRHCKSIKRGKRSVILACIAVSWIFSIIWSLQVLIPEKYYTSEGGNQRQDLYDNLLLQLIILYVLPLSITLACFIRVAREFWMLRFGIYPRGHMAINAFSCQRARRERAASRMFATVVVVKFLSETISFVLEFSILHSSPGTPLSSLVTGTLSCTAAVNPLIYVLGDQRCRCRLSRMLLRWWQVIKNCRMAESSRNISIFVMQPRISLVQGSHVNSNMPEPALTEASKFQTKRRMSDVNGHPVLVIEFENKDDEYLKSVDNNAETPILKFPTPEEPDDLRDDRSNLAPESLFGNISVQSVASSTGSPYLPRDISDCDTPIDMQGNAKTSSNMPSHNTSFSGTGNTLQSNALSPGNSHTGFSSTRGIPQGKNTTVGTHGLGGGDIKGSSFTAVESFDHDVADPAGLRSLLSKLERYTRNKDEVAQPSVENGNISNNIHIQAVHDEVNSYKNNIAKQDISNQSEGIQPRRAQKLGGVARSKPKSLKVEEKLSLQSVTSNDRHWD